MNSPLPKWDPIGVEPWPNRKPKGKRSIRFGQLTSLVPLGLRVWFEFHGLSRLVLNHGHVSISDLAAPISVRAPGLHAALLGRPAPCTGRSKPPGRPRMGCFGTWRVLVFGRRSQLPSGFPWEKQGILFWLTLKGNPSQKRKAHHWATGVLKGNKWKTLRQRRLSRKGTLPSFKFVEAGAVGGVRKTKAFSLRSLLSLTVGYTTILSGIGSRSTPTNGPFPR